MYVTEGAAWVLRLTELVDRRDAAITKMSVSWLLREWPEVYTIVLLNPDRLFEVVCSILRAAAVVHSHANVQTICFLI